MNQAIISFELTQEEKELIERVYYLEPWLPDAVDNRRRKGNKYQFKLTDDEVNDCLSALEYQAELETAEKFKFISLARKIRQYSYLLKGF